MKTEVTTSGLKPNDRNWRWRAGSGGDLAVGEGDRARQLARYVAGSATRELPSDILDAARIALIDFCGVAIGAAEERVSKATRDVAEKWQMPGRAWVFCGKRTGAAMAALANGSAAHAMDFDDTHLWGGGHIGAPCWSTALAIAADRELDEMAALKGFVAGYEVMARLGGGGMGGIGRNMQQRGLHPTGVNGGVGAAAAAAAMIGLDEERCLNALSIAGTSAAGLVASFGSDSKPFHAGRAAMAGILAADLAASGMVGSPRVFDLDRGMVPAFIQDRNAIVPPLDFDDGWELAHNGYKPFACCRAAHASIQAAHSLIDAIGDRRISRIRARVHKTAPFTAGNPDPQTPLEAKFSVAFCIAMALSGYRAGASDFSEQTLSDARVRDLCAIVTVEPVDEQPQYEAYLDVWLEDGTHLKAETKAFLGHPDNPMSLDDHRDKFFSLVTPVVGAEKTAGVFEILSTFGSRTSLTDLERLTRSEL